MAFSAQDCLRDAVDYIEENLAGEIDYDAAAKIACSSSFHFQRVFSYVIGLPLAEYVRRRRMTLAAFDLQSGGMKAVDVALKYGYDSHSSFSRAFQAFHGITPSAARLNGAVLKAYPRVGFMINVSGTNEMKYRIMENGRFFIFGVSIPLSPEENIIPAVFEKLGRYAEEAIWNGTHDATNRAAGRQPGSYLWGVRFAFRPDGSCRFMFAAEKPDGDLAGDSAFTMINVPAMTWAVFDYASVIYPETAEHLYRSIYAHWFPTSGYEQAEGPCLEKFFEDRMEAWIPIKRIYPE